MRVRCIDASHSVHCLEENKVYTVTEKEIGSDALSYIWLEGVVGGWIKTRFEEVPDDAR